VTRPARADLLAALAVLLLTSLAAASCRPPDPRPSVVVVTFDTTRFDHTSLAGYARDTTPHLAALAAEGASFRTAYAPTSTTGPSHASLFTGQTPLRHGVTKNGAPLPDESETMAEGLAAAGYRTAAFVSSFVLSRRFAFDQGFATFDDAFDPATSTFAEKFWEGKELEGGFDRRADETTRRAVAWLDANAKRGPFFLFVHYFDPHAPYVPPAAFANRFVPPADGGALARDVARYDEEIAFTDAALGALLAALERLGRKQDTLVVVTADHGEGLMDHGHMEHGVSVYEEQVRIPLVVRWPGRVAAGRTFDVPVSLVDVAPTAYALLGLAPPAEPVEGRSLARALADGAAPEALPVYLYRRHFAGEQRAETWVVGEKFGVRDGRWKYVDGPEEKTRELFDLDADPKELVNRLGDEPNATEALAARVAGWRGGRTGPAAGKLDITPEERERLRVLGYTE
jgi:arylsulfatase A-like enzyme